MTQTTFRDLTRLHPTEAVYTLFTDFNTYTTTDWILTTTEAGGGSASEALSDALGGVLVVTNDAAENDLDAFQWAGNKGSVCETFKYQSGKSFRIWGRFKILEVVQCDFMMGVYVTDTDPIGGVTDGIYIRSADGVATLQGVLEKNSTETSVEMGSLVANTWHTFEIYHNGGTASGTSSVDFYLDGVRVGGTRTLTNLCDDEELAMSFVIQNGEAVINVLSVDYIGIQCER